MLTAAVKSTPPAAISRCGNRPARPLAKAQPAIRRQQDDREKHEADQRVEPLGSDEVDREGAEKHEEDRAEEGAGWMPRAADDGDNQDVDEAVDTNRARRNAAVEPDEQDSAKAGDQAG